MSRAPEFFSVPPLAAVALLGVNDHFLKRTFHNAVTGKLSDFAGCFFLPLFVSAVLTLFTRWSLNVRMGLGVAATLIIFVPASLSRTAADFICRTVEIVAIPLGIGAQKIASDPTDLIALPMVALAVVYARWKSGAAVAAVAPVQST